MLNFTGQTGSGAVIMVWSFPSLSERWRYGVVSRGRMGRDGGGMVVSVVQSATSEWGFRGQILGGRKSS